MIGFPLTSPLVRTCLGRKSWEKLTASTSTPPQHQIKKESKKEPGIEDIVHIASTRRATRSKERLHKEIIIKKTEHGGGQGKGSYFTRAFTLGRDNSVTSPHSTRGVHRNTEEACNDHHKVLQWRP